MAALTVDIERSADRVRAHVRGDVTDSADFSALTALEDVHLDLYVTDLRRFNSGGVSHWIQLMWKLGTRCKRIELHDVGDAFLYQTMLTPALRGKAIIRSMRLSYFCERCETTSTVPVERAQHFPEGILHPPEGPTCPSCGNAQELDSVFDGARL